MSTLARPARILGQVALLTAVTALAAGLSDAPAYRQIPQTKIGRAHV
jgi:hypothetical protein